MAQTTEITLIEINWRTQCTVDSWKRNSSISIECIAYVHSNANSSCWLNTAEQWAIL